MAKKTGTGRKNRLITDGWDFVFLLHNLELNAAIESEFIAIVPNGEARIRKIISRVPAVAPLVRNFTDQNGKTRKPCSLIVRKDAPVQIGSQEAIISFRNIIALSCLLRAWPITIGSLNVFSPLWSDFFDFYPTTLMRDPNFLHTLSPATNGGCLPINFRGQVSPNLPNPIHFRFEPDYIIFPLLLNAWQKEFAETNPPDAKRRVLFRSVEMAYQAASLPSNSRSTIYDFGSRLALWVSAFEVLVHPGILPDGKTGKADLEKVTNLLGRFLWRNLLLKKSGHQIQIKGKSESVNLVQKLYGELFQARNDFLHGNPVVSSRLFCFCNERRRSLVEIAPVIYKVALSCFFGEFGDIVKKSDQEPNYKEFFERDILEKALLATLEDRQR